MANKTLWVVPVLGAMAAAVIGVWRIPPMAPGVWTTKGAGAGVAALVSMIGAAGVAVGVWVPRIGTKPTVGPVVGFCPAPT
jgi:hypothetical protein